MKTLQQRLEAFVASAEVEFHRAKRALAEDRESRPALLIYRAAKQRFRSSYRLFDVHPDTFQAALKGQPISSGDLWCIETVLSRLEGSEPADHVAGDGQALAAAIVERAFQDLREPAQRTEALRFLREDLWDSHWSQYLPITQKQMEARLHEIHGR